MWTRSDDLYEKLRGKEKFLRGSEYVEFFNYANFGILGSIELKILPVSHILEIELRPSPFALEKMRRLCNEKFLSTELNFIYDTTIFIICESPVPILKLIALFQEINQQSSIEEFSKEIFQELEQLAELYSGKSKRNISQFHHYLPSFKRPNVFQAALGDEDRGLNEVYDWTLKYTYQDEYPIKQLSNILARRIDIKEWYASLERAIRFNRPYVLILLMSYGANPFIRASGKSIFEIAKSACNPCMVDAMVTYVTRPQKPINSMELADFTKMFIRVNRLSKIFHFKNEINNGSLYTHFKTNEGDVTLVLRETDTLSKIEMDQAFQFYEDYFESSPACKTNSKEFFDYDTKGPRKFFQGIMLNGQLVAIHFLEYITLKEYPDNIYFHISCVYAKDCIRGKGFTNPLIKMLGYVFQDLFENKNIIQVMQSISVGSLALVEGVRYFPKYVLPFFTKDMMEKLISHMQRNPDAKSTDQPVPLVMDEPVCYSAIESQMKSPKDMKKQTNEQSPKEFFLDRFHRGITHRGTQKHHAALVACLLSDETWEIDSKACKAMELEPNHFVKDYGRFFSTYVSDLKPHNNYNKPVYLPDSNELLLRNQRVLTKSAILPQK